jgi:sulfatase maturation enzyme AslB (radical SAM superfamily)
MLHFMEMYFALDDIKEIQIDHTTRCNLACPQCARTDSEWFKDPRYRNVDLNLNDYKIILEPFSNKSVRVFHCGNYGDALASPTFDETFDYTLSVSSGQIAIATNGSLRSPAWWRDLAHRGGRRLRVIFSIDGLEDTNHIYRKGSIWKKIMENAKAFIEHGGHARWDFIEFEHNYHQIEQARELAQAMGFKIFNAKYTARFASQGLKIQEVAGGSTIADRKDNVNQKDYSEVQQSFGSFDEYVRKTPISCKSVRDKRLFIDMFMRLWPCCWFGAPLYFKKETQQTKDFKYLIDLYGPDFNNLRKHGWQILDHEFFRSYLKNSWDSPDQKFRRIYTCGRTCGQKFEFSSGYGKNKNPIQLKGDLNVSTK